MIATYAIHNWPIYIIVPAQVNPSFPYPNYIIWKGPLPHKYTPVRVTYVRESLGGVTGVGGDPNQVPTGGSFLWSLKNLTVPMIFIHTIQFKYICSSYKKLDNFNI